MKTESIINLDFCLPVEELSRKLVTIRLLMRLLPGYLIVVSGAEVLQRADAWDGNRRTMDGHEVAEFERTKGARDRLA
jgi:hypothetical protein